MNEEIKQTNDIIYDLYKLYIPLELDYYNKEGYYFNEDGYRTCYSYDEMIELSQKSAMKRAISGSLIYTDMIHELLCVGEKK